MKQLIVFGLCAVALAAAFNGAAGREITVVYPHEFATKEGSDGDDGTFVWQSGTRVQAVFLASEFESLPETHRQIVGYRYRPDGVLLKTPMTVTWDFSLRLSTTPLESLDEMSSVFADNAGLPDETLVYEGALELTTLNLGPVGGPKDFDYEVRFETPFFYDPSQGNLLYDSIQTGPTRVPGTDYHLGETPYGFGLFAPESSAAAATQRFSYNPFIVEFLFVPEPSSAIPSLIGLLGLLQLRCRVIP